MLGRGLIALRYNEKRNELHSWSPWELLKNEHAIECMLFYVRENKLEPFAVVNDDEVNKIKEAKSINVESKKFHQYASDWVEVIENPDRELTAITDEDKLMIFMNIGKYKEASEILLKNKENMPELLKRIHSTLTDD